MRGHAWRQGTRIGAAAIAAACVGTAAFTATATGAGSTAVRHAEVIRSHAVRGSLHFGAAAESMLPPARLPPANPVWGALAFTSPRDGWAVATLTGGARSTLLRTRDGGRTWVPGHGPAGRLSVLAFRGGTGWVASGATLYRTTDGGAVWRAVWKAPSPIGSLSLPTARVGWLVAGQEWFMATSLWQTSDGGLHWRGPAAV